MHLQEGSKATVVFCQQGSTTVRCLQVSQLVPVKGSKEKPGGQLRTDNKKPIAALAAAPCQKLEVLVLYADGSLSSCTCNPATRTIVTRWCIAVDPARTVLHKVGWLRPVSRVNCRLQSGHEGVQWTLSCSVALSGLMGSNATGI